MGYQFDARCDGIVIVELPVRREIKLHWDLIVSLSKKLYPHCSVLAVVLSNFVFIIIIISRNRLECNFVSRVTSVTIKLCLKVCPTSDLPCVS